MVSYKHPRPALTVDIVVFGVDIRAPASDSDDSSKDVLSNELKLKILLVRRKHAPFKNSLALPGGFLDVNSGESLEEAAFRELKEETNLEPSYLEQLYTFGTPKRDPRERVVSVAYMALVQRSQHKIAAGSDAKTAAFYDNEVLNLDDLAFDHKDIVKKARERLVSKVRYAPVGFDLLPRVFTLGELQQLYELILGRQLDKANFRKKISGLGILTRVGERVIYGRTSVTYSFDRGFYQDAIKRGINFEI